MVFSTKYLFWKFLHQIMCLFDIKIKISKILKSKKKKTIGRKIIIIYKSCISKQVKWKSNTKIQNTRNALNFTFSYYKIVANLLPYLYCTSVVHLIYQIKKKYNTWILYNFTSAKSFSVPLFTYYVILEYFSLSRS